MIKSGLAQRGGQSQSTGAAIGIWQHVGNVTLRVMPRRGSLQPRDSKGGKLCRLTMDQDVIPLTPDVQDTHFPITSFVHTIEVSDCVRHKTWGRNSGTRGACFDVCSASRRQPSKSA